MRIRFTRLDDRQKRYGVFYDFDIGDIGFIDIHFAGYMLSVSWLKCW